MSVRESLKEVLAQFKTAEFWVALMLILFFSVLSYFLVHYAFLTDNILLDTRGVRCLPLTNLSVIFLFCSMIFFGFFALLMLGELQNYFNFKGMGDFKNSNKSLSFSAIWGLISTLIASAVLVFFNSICW